MDLISPVPVFNLYNSEWPIYTRQSISPPAKFVRGKNNTVGTALDSIVASGVVISGGIVEGSVLSNDVYVGTSSRVLDSVLMDKVNVGEGAVVKRAIIDKNVKVPAGRRDRPRPRTGPRPRLQGHRLRHHRPVQGPAVPEPGDAERALSAANLHLVPDAVRAATENWPELRESVEKVAEVQAAAVGVRTPGAGRRHGLQRRRGPGSLASGRAPAACKIRAMSSPDLSSDSRAGC